MPLRLSGTIELSAVDDRSFTGVASIGKLRERVYQYSWRFMERQEHPLVSNLPVNDNLEVEFWILGVARIDLDRRPNSPSQTSKDG